MAKLIIASLLSLLLLQFAFQGVEGEPGTTGAACAEGACTASHDHCENNVCKTKVGSACTESGHCIEHAECHTNCKCADHYAHNAGNTECHAGTADHDHECDTHQTDVSKTCKTGLTCSDHKCHTADHHDGAGSVAASLSLMAVAFITSRFL